MVTGRYFPEGFFFFFNSLHGDRAVILLLSISKRPVCEVVSEGEALCSHLPGISEESVQSVTSQAMDLQCTFKVGTKQRR